jgi:hypothetical protein
VNLYITFDSRDKIKKSFLNLRKYLLIATDSVIQDLGYCKNELDECSQFLINEEIKNLIRKGCGRKKLLALIYSNPEMDDLIIREMIHYCSEITAIKKIIFLVERGKREEYYELFDEVVFYPSLKKVHIIECHPIPVDYISGKMDEEFFFN